MHDHDFDEIELLKWPEPLPAAWRLEETEPAAGFALAFNVTESGESRGRCQSVLAGRSEVRDAYPISAHDQVISVSDEVVAGSIQLVAEELMRRDRECRRLVIAAAEGDVREIARAEQAGFRYVVDVDLWDRSVSLLVAEPMWVLEESRNIDVVPTT